MQNGINSYYVLKARLYIPNVDDYDIYLNFNGDGVTGAMNGAQYGGEGSFRINNGKIMFGYPGAWHMPYASAESTANGAIQKGVWITLEIGVNGRNASD